MDIREYEEAQYRKLFAVVFQDFKIFSFRFGENIAAGEKVDEERAMDAIRRVDLMRLYNKMPDGLNTILNRDFFWNWHGNLGVASTENSNVTRYL